MHSTTVNSAPGSSSFRQVCTQCLISDTGRWTANKPKETSQRCRQGFYQGNNHLAGPPGARGPPQRSEARFFWGKVASRGHGHWLQVGFLICYNSETGLTLTLKHCPCKNHQCFSIGNEIRYIKIQIDVAIFFFNALELPKIFSFLIMGSSFQAVSTTIFMLLINTFV